MEEYVILVDENDQPQGLMEKMEAHEKGVLHRAFSIFLFNQRGEMLIHQRAKEKYHSGGLWTNTCCSHPRDGESSMDAAVRRLHEEMGIKCPLQEKFSFIYRAEFDHGLVEHELDHVFMGSYDGEIKPNPAEVMDWKYVHIDLLLADMEEHPENYTAWFKIALPKVLEG
jgi:isopentenyl-diphosphate delta-isomerase